MVLVYYQGTYFAMTPNMNIRRKWEKLPWKSVKEKKKVLSKSLGLVDFASFLASGFYCPLAHGRVKFPGIPSDRSTVRGGIFKRLCGLITPGFQGGQIDNDVVFPQYGVFLTLHKNQAFTINNTVRSIDLICGPKGSDPNNLLIEFQFWMTTPFPREVLIIYSINYF